MSPEPKQSNSAASSFGGLPIVAVCMELWMMPFTLAARMMGLGNPVAAAEDEPEIDREPEKGQLPVPNPLQEAKDSDLFA